MKKVLFKSKAFILLLIMALLFCMAPQFAFTAYADETASFEVNASECSVIGEYMDGDVYYCVAPEGTAEVVFKDYEGNMEEGMITGLQSGMVEGTNVAPVSGEFRATWETMNSNDSIEFAEGAEDLDYSNAYFYFIMDDDYEMASFVVQVTTPPADDTVFTSNVGVISGPEEDAYAYVFYDPSQGWAPVNATADLYTLTVPYGTQEVTLDFGETKTISYNYDADGNYLYGWYDDSTIGETTTTKKVDSNKDSIPDYIWVQNPYNADYTGGELLYVIKLEYSYTFKCSVDGKEMTEISFTPENYSYTDWLGVTSIVGTYTVTLPYGTEKVDLDFSDNVLCYNYTKDGNYLGGYYVDFETGGKEAHGIPVDYSDAMTPADGEFDYIQVQTPYDEAYNSTLLYTVTFEYVNPPFTTDNGTITGPVKGGYQYTAYVYDPEDPEADSYGYVAKPGEADLFTVNLSSLKDVKDITISFLMDETISYNYDEYGNFLAGKYADPTVGETETTKPIDSNNDGVLDYIWVQHPYNADYSGGELIYVIKLSYVPCAEKIKDVYDMLVTQADKLMSDDANAAYGVGDWFIFDQARDGRDVNPNYLESVKKYVNDHEGDLVNGGNYYSNYSRTILAMTALGADARTFTDYNLLEYLADFKNVKAQGLNGVIWALLAVDCHVYEIPEVEGVAEEDLTTNDMMINYILDAFLEDGGWALRGTTPDVDITAMAIASLAPYMFDDNVNEKVEKAVQWLSDNQNDDGSFSALNPDGTTIPTAESTAMVAIALSSLGIDPASDMRFIKNEKSVMCGLCSFAVLEGDAVGIKHIANGPVNTLATEQAYRAFASYMRLLNNDTSLYDLTDQMLITRVYGETRYETSLEVAERYMKNNSIDKLDKVIIATGDDFPDALSGSSLSIVNDAPVILISTKVQSSQDAATAFIKENLKEGGQVLIVGGDGVVPGEYQNSLKALGYEVERYSGESRYDTNLAILKALGESDSLLVCSGITYADAATASATGLPVLLVGKQLEEVQIEYLKSVGKKDIYIIGGDAAVSGDLDAVLAEYDNDGTVERVWGDDRALTAVAVAEQFFGDELDYGNVVFAYGGNFPDCIAGGLLAASLDAPILYGGAHQTYTDAGKPFIDKWNIRTAYVLGGPTLISDEFVRNMA